MSNRYNQPRCNQPLTCQPVADPCNTAAEMKAFMSGLTAWCQPDADLGYGCGVWKLYKGEIWENLIPGNKTQPSDYNTSWRKLGDVIDILQQLLDDAATYELSLPFWPSCTAAGPNCVSSFGEGACAVDLVPVLNADGSPALNSCGNPIIRPLIFESEVPRNTDRPRDGAKANPKTWSGGYTPCEYLNRPVTVNKNGALHYPGPADSRLCSIGCGEIDNKGIVWKQNPAGKFELSLGQIGVDKSGNPVMAGACLATCGSVVSVVAIDDSKPGVTTITLSDGTVISGPEVDNDVKVASFGLAGNVLTITMTDGATFTTTLPATADAFVTAINIDGSGNVTLTRNNGLPPLTAKIQFPAGTGPSITDLGSTVNNLTGMVSVTSSDGNDTAFRIDAPEMFPSAWVRVGTTNNQGVSGDKPPNVSISTGKSNLFGGFSYNAAGHLVVPKAGIYRIMYRAAAIGQMQGLYPTGQRCLVKLMINGVQFSQLTEDDHTGTHTGEELNDFREHILEFAQGDTITINTAEETPTHWLDAYDITINLVSGK